MGRTLPNEFIDEAVKSRSTAPFIWLVELQIDSSEAVRICAYDQEVTFEGDTWYPFPFKVGTRIESSNQAIEQLSLTASNIGRAPSILLNTGLIIGKRARVLLVHSDLLSDTTAKLEGAFVVQTATAREDTVTFTLGISNPLGLPFPAERFWRTRCRFLKEYGSGRCGYDVDLPNAISATNTDFDTTTCDGTLGVAASGNGCKAHGFNELSNGAAQIHPERFGGAPGIPKGSIS